MNQTVSIDYKATGTTQAAAGGKEVAASVEQVGTQSEETSKKTSGLTNAMKGLATGFAIYKGAQFIKSAVTETTSLAKSTVILTRLTGMDTKQASAWVGIAEERGISTKQLNTGFITLSKQLVALGQGTKSSVEAFNTLGLSQDQLKGKSTEQALDLISDSLSKLPAGANKAAIAQKLLGRSSQQLLPLINQGSGALDEQTSAMAKSLGMTGDTIKNSLQLVKTQREWQATVMGLKIAIATALLPIITQLAKIIEPLAQGFATAMRSSEAFRVIVISLTAALTTFIAITRILALMGIEVEGAWIWAIIVPALIIGVGVALVMLYNKVGWFRDGVNAAFGAVKAAIKAVFDWVKQNWPLLLVILTGPIGAATLFVITHWKQIKDAVVGVVDAITGAMKAVASVVSGVLGGAFNIVVKSIHAVVNGINDIVNTAKKITSLPGKALHVLTGGVGSAVGFLTGHATGGYASRAGVALVGENGPELVHLPQGSRVSPFGAQTAGGGGKVTVHTHIYIGKRQIALAMGDYVADQQAAR